MRLSGGISLVVCALGAIALGLPAAASAAPPPSNVKVAKHKDGPFVDEFTSANVSQPKNLYMRAINEVGTPQDFRLTDLSVGTGEPDYHIRWFKGHKNVSHDVQNLGYEFKVKPGHPKTFRVQVKPDIANPDPFCLAGVFVNTTDSYELYGLIAINAGNACD